MTLSKGTLKVKGECHSSTWLKTKWFSGLKNYKFSEFGMALDRIADANNVLIVKSAGNSTKFLHGGKTERISQMADSVRALVVGSVAEERGPYDLAEVDMPSPFSRTGPGPEYIVKPDLTAYGGNAGICNGNITLTGVPTINENGVFSRSAGTSFSTPWVARIAAELAYFMDGEFDPLLIKALMVHHATYPKGCRLGMEDRSKFMGFGMPSGTRDVLYNSENEITLILRDSLEKGKFINILDFPFPKSLVGEDGFFRGQIVVTVVGKPLLKSTEGPEYCQSDIHVAFGTMDGVKLRDTSKPTVRNEYGPEGNKNIMNADLYSRGTFDLLEGDSFDRERTLIRYGQKYYPVKKYAVDLEEMTKGNRTKYLRKDRKWYLKVTGLFRDEVEREAARTGEILQQDFCIMITIRDPEGTVPVYNEVTQQLHAENFVNAGIRLRNEVHELVIVEEKE